MSISLRPSFLPPHLSTYISLINEPKGYIIHVERMIKTEGITSITKLANCLSSDDFDS